jgi:hypothetical protein
MADTSINETMEVDCASLPCVGLETSFSSLRSLYFLCDYLSIDGNARLLLEIVDGHRVIA